MYHKYRSQAGAGDQNVLTNESVTLTPRSIHHLVEDGDIPALQDLSKTTENLKLRDNEGATALYRAAESGQLEAVRLLLNAGAHVNARKRKRWIPLHAAAKNNHADVIEALLIAGADINRETNRNMTSVMLAAKHVGHESASCLIQNGCDVNVRDKFNRTTIHWAIKGGSLNLLKSLEVAGADLYVDDKFKKTALHQAVKANKPHILAYLLTKNLDITCEEKHFRTPLHLAASKDRAECSEVLMDHGVSPDIRSSNSRTPLQIAADECRYNIMKALLKHGADPNLTDSFETTALHQVSLRSRLHTHVSRRPRRPYYDCAMLLLDANADLDMRTAPRTFWTSGQNRPQTALEMATNFANEVGLIKLLAKAGTKPGNMLELMARDESEWSPGLQQNPAIISWLREHYSQPPLLKELCRKVIRTNISYPFQDKLNNWNIAIGVKNYLHFSDFQDLTTEFSCLSADGSHHDSEPDGDSQGEYEASVFRSEYGDKPNIVDTDSDEN